MIVLFALMALLALSLIGRLAMLWIDAESGVRWMNERNGR